MSDLIHRLFYWNWNGRYILSKSKTFSLLLFIVLILHGIAASTVMGITVFAVLFSMIVFLSGFVIHKILPAPSKAKLENSDNGLLTDLKHLFLHWQDRKTGKFYESKTKLISVIIFIIAAVLSFLTMPITIAGNVFMGLIFSVPAFIIGSGVHKLTGGSKKEIPAAEEKPKIQTPKYKVVERPKVIEKPEPEPEKEPAFEEYRTQINKLKDEYSVKEKNARKLIAEKFTPPQISYDKFIGVVNNSTKLFNTQVASAETMMDLADEESVSIRHELDSKIDVLDKIIDRMDNLINELVISMSKDSDDGEVHDLLDDMERLIDSVKKYD